MPIFKRQKVGQSNGMWGIVLIGFLFGECDPQLANTIEDTTNENNTLSEDTNENPPITTPEPVLVSPPTETCEDKIAKILDLKISSSIQRYEKMLPYVILNTNVVPLIYITNPKKSDNTKPRGISNALGNVPSVRKAIGNLKKKYNEDKNMLREIFLADGYFFDDRTHVAPAMSREITLRDLFDDPVIYRLRGNRLSTLTFKNGEYMDPEGIPSTLRLGDRVSKEISSLYPPLHLDAAFIKQNTGAVRIIVEKRFENGAAITLRFPSGETRPALVRIEDNQTTIDCIGGDPATLSKSLEAAKKFFERHERVVASAERLVAERPLFDEPQDEGEEVQEDGELRLAWKEAYRNRQKTFWYREIEYSVFDRKGNPVPPEVCVDFIIDTWERAAGTWYTPRGTRPARTEGEIDFYALEGLSRRYISSILDYARREESPFSRYDVPRRDWAPLENRRIFARKLAKHADAFQEGDLLVIHGLREEDMEEHYHTVLVLKTDPVTGIPTRIADNQGRPRISTLVQAMRAAPKRSVKYRLRLDYDQMRRMTEEYRTRQEDE